MSRRNDSIADGIIMMTSYMPWWVCLIFSVLSYISLSSLAGIQVEQTDMGNFVIKQFLVTMAFFGKIIIPILFIFAAIISKSQNNEELWPKKYTKMTIAAGILMTVIILMISKPSKQEEKKWSIKGNEIIYTGTGNPFSFDIWEAEKIKDVLFIKAKEQNINPIESGDHYRYITKLLNEQAAVTLYFTSKSRKLMKVVIDWAVAKKIEGAINEMVERQNPISEKPKNGFMSKGKSYQINERTEIDLEKTSGISMRMTYKDLPLIDLEEKERAEKTMEDQKNAVEKEGSKFFSKQ